VAALVPSRTIFEPSGSRKNYSSTPPGGIEPAHRRVCLLLLPKRRKSGWATSSALTNITVPRSQRIAMTLVKTPSEKVIVNRTTMRIGFRSLLSVVRNYVMKLKQ
jgi:hypothetical protein